MDPLPSITLTSLGIAVLAYTVYGAGRKVCAMRSTTTTATTRLYLAKTKG